MRTPKNNNVVGGGGNRRFNIKKEMSLVILKMLNIRECSVRFKDRQHHVAADSQYSHIFGLLG